MISPVEIAHYYAGRYLREQSIPIEEERLQAMLYLAQKESLIQTGRPLFIEEFEARRCGPIIKSVHREFIKQAFMQPSSVAISASSVVDIYQKYAGKDMWHLSTLMHAAPAWKKARIRAEKKRLPSDSISIDDLKSEAVDSAQRRAFLQQIKEAENQ